MSESDLIHTKAITGFEIKDADRGEVTAIVSVFNVVDRDGDVILPGAIRDGTPVKLSAYRHDVITEGAPPVGRGTLAVDSHRALLNAKYFMSTTRAQQAFATIKELGSDSEWSIGYLKDVETMPMTKEWRAKGAKRLIVGMDVIESSPVFMGANQFTSTLGVKSAVDSQADGVVDDGLVAEVVAEITARREAVQLEARRIREEAETKAIADQEAERVRVEAETKAVTEAESARVAAEEADRVVAETKAAEEADAARMAPLIALRDRFLRTMDEHAPSAQREVERFQQTLRRHGMI